MCPPQSPLSGQKAHAGLKPRRVLFVCFRFVLTKRRGEGKKMQEKGKIRIPRDLSAAADGG